MTEDDGKLIQLSLEGDMDAFGVLVEKYRNRATWVAKNMVGSYEDALDISQEAFVRIFRSLARFQQGKNFYTWLYQIVVNLSIDHLRKHRKVRKVSLDKVGDIESGAETPDKPVEREELRADVRKVLDELPDKYKAVMVLRDIEGLSCKEIGEITGCTHATVRWRLHRARNIFREIWEKKFQCKEGEHYGLP